jgi:two-component system, cell cycle response regulator
MGSLQWYVDAPAAPLHEGRFGRCLVVDDDEDGRVLLQAYLEDCGISVVTASDAKSAIALCANGEVEVVVLDLGLPGKDGLTLCEELRAMEQTRHLGLVAHTGFSSLSRSARAAGFDAMAVKPQDGLVLVDLVRRLSELAKLRRT